jgi:hypothetical protein
VDDQTRADKVNTINICNNLSNIDIIKLKIMINYKLYVKREEKNHRESRKEAHIIYINISPVYLVP